AGDPARQAVVQRQRQPAADDRPVRRRQALGERDGRGVEPHPGAQVLEVRAVHDRHLPNVRPNENLTVTWASTMPCSTHQPSGKTWTYPSSRTASTRPLALT